MSDTSNIDKDSVLEYSLSEIGFILVFVLLLLSAFEINDNFQKQEEKEADLIILEEKIIEQEEQIVLLREAISIIDGGEEWKDDMELVSKSERLIDKQKIQELQDQLDDLQSAYEDRLAEIEPDGTDQLDKQSKGDGLLAGDVGFCTYAAPSPDSSRLYGRSLAVGTVIIGEEYLTVVDKNLSLASMEVVDIAGKPYDTSLVMDAIERLPLNVPLSPNEFKQIGREFVEIGDLPSNHRVACRFGMNWYKEVYTKKSDFNFLRVFQNVFFVNDELSDDDAAQFLVSQSNFSDSIDYVIENSEPESPKFDVDESARSSSEDKKLKSLSGFKAQNKLSGSAPKYPSKASRQGITGYVTLRYSVNPSGSVTDIRIIEESPPGFKFGRESIKALEKWRYEPAEIDGIPVRSDGLQIRFSFE